MQQIMIASDREALGDVVLVEAQLEGRERIVVGGRVPSQAAMANEVTSEASKAVRTKCMGSFLKENGYARTRARTQGHNTACRSAELRRRVGPTRSGSRVRGAQRRGGERDRTRCGRGSRRPRAATNAGSTGDTKSCDWLVAGAHRRLSPGVWLVVRAVAVARVGAAAVVTRANRAQLCGRHRQRDHDRDHDGRSRYRRNLHP